MEKKITIRVRFSDVGCRPGNLLNPNSSVVIFLGIKLERGKEEINTKKKNSLKNIYGHLQLFITEILK